MWHSITFANNKSFDEMYSLIIYTFANSSYIAMSNAIKLHVIVSQLRSLLTYVHFTLYFINITDNYYYYHRV